MAKILIIDDDADLRGFLQSALLEQQHQVMALEQADRAPALLSEGGFDLVLLDNKMPGMSGIDFLSILQQRGIRVPVILMTGHTTTDTAIQAMNLGAFDYIIKPSDFELLLTELQPLIREAVSLARPTPAVRVQSETPVDDPSIPALLGKSKLMLEVYKLIGRFARSDEPVLILGETGSGKELVARAIHTNSPRKDKPFVALNCTALNETLLDDELFGHEPGAFTGAEKLRKGRFEYANGGTLFLDELGDMPLPLQAKLLRVLETREVCRIGSNDVIKVQVRLVSATHRNFDTAVAEGKFRHDLLFRLNRLPIRLPPLRQRDEDIELLARHCLARAAREAGMPAPSIDESALAKLRGHSWPGNVRELQTVMYRAVRLCRGPSLSAPQLDLAAAAGSGGAAPERLGETEALAQLQAFLRWGWHSGQARLFPVLQEILERELLQLALHELGGNQTQVADRLGVARGTVIDRTRKYGLK